MNYKIEKLQEKIKRVRQELKEIDEIIADLATQGKDIKEDVKKWIDIYCYKGEFNFIATNELFHMYNKLNPVILKKDFYKCILELGFERKQLKSGIYAFIGICNKDNIQKVRDKNPWVEVIKKEDV